MAKAPAPDLALVEADLRQAISIAKSQGAATLEAEATARLHDVLGHHMPRRRFPQTLTSERTHSER
jgi:hypothetical protein